MSEILNDAPAWFDDLLAEISELVKLEESWDSYGARPIDPHCVEATANLFLPIFNSDTPRPSVVPINRGGIQLEWHRAGTDLEIEIEPPERLHVFFGKDRETTEAEMMLTDDLRPLARFLEGLKEAD
ncbi:MAG: hypothetical protein ABSG53_07845 [Thermoguttaceae bacterium]|jgi:hypothetical protein